MTRGRSTPAAAGRRTDHPDDARRDPGAYVDREPGDDQVGEAGESR